jgi:GTP-binding protein
LVAAERTTPKQAMAEIQDEEPVDLTPRSIRLRKHYLDPHERKRQSPKEQAGWGRTSLCALSRTC